jgi:hypothetical protein
MTEVDNEKYKKIMPIFRLKPQKHNTSCIVTHVGYIDTEKETLLDEVIDINTSDYEIKRFGKNVDYIKTLNNYDITGIIMRNNIKGDILIKGEYFPIYSLSIGFTKNTTTGFLFDIFIGFAPDQESLGILKMPKHVTNATLTGTYTMKVYCDQTVNEKFASFIDSIEDSIIEDLDIVNAVALMDEDKGIEYLQEKINEKKEFYKDLQNGYLNFNYKNHEDIINKLRDLYRTRKIDELIKFTLIESEKKRAKKYNAIESYEIPKNIIKLNDIKNNLDNLSEILQK